MTMQEFLADATLKAANDLAEAVERLPEERRAWSAGGDARTALDQVAECALTTGYTAELVQTRQWNPDSFTEYGPRRDALLAVGWKALQESLQENTRRHLAILRAVPSASLAEEIVLPYGKQTVAELLARPYWNMTYHLGQVNYIASLPVVSDTG